MTARRPTTDAAARRGRQRPSPWPDTGIQRGAIGGTPFTQIRNDLFRDKRLSWKAKGLFGWLSTHAQGHPVTLDDMVKAGTDKRAAVRTALGELMELGYVRRLQNRAHNDLGHLGPFTYLITDEPTTQPTAYVPGSENRIQAESTLEKSHTHSTTPTFDFRIQAQSMNTTAPVKTNSTHTEHSSAPTQPLVSDTAGAHLLRSLKLRIPVTQQIIRTYAQMVDDLLGTWPPETLRQHLQRECGGPEIRNPMGRLVTAIRDVHATWQSSAVHDVSAHTTPWAPCTQCGSPYPGGMITLTQDGQDAAAPCPGCNPRAASEAGDG